ncbi:MAG: hypothetical protein CMM07_26690 [Rhodopirellula sp.]|nr:hypothetical protein [Rhodopirellula sp.]
MPCKFLMHREKFLQCLQVVKAGSIGINVGCLVFVVIFGGHVKAETPTGDGLSVTLKDTGEEVKVMLGDKVFTEFDYRDYDKPILYPIYGPGQVGMTRNWPMKKDVVGEAHDHPHHKSMWISHEISGIDFWGESEGKVVTETVETSFAGSPKPGNVLRATSVWKTKKEDKPLLTDQTTYWFGGTNKSRWIDCLVDFEATYGDIQFDDTKEGLFAIRTHPDLRLTNAPKRGVEKVFGTAINSEGVSGKAIWGKRARWLLYTGMIDERPMSIAMYDHPSNLRHPTTWHARDYGLVTANPFGMHHFLSKEKGAGAFKIAKDAHLKLRYRVEFFSGRVTPDDVEASYKRFAEKLLVEPLATKE